MVLKKSNNISVFIEFIASSGLALFFHWGLHNKEAATIIFGVGLLLSLATYLMREDMEETREDLLKQYHYAHEITFAIAGISDHECQAKAQELMTGVKGTIQLLQQGYIPLEETEFYLEAARTVDSATRHVKTVDPNTHGWNSRGSLRNFYQSNVRAIERGIKLTRIFVIDRDEVADPEVQKVILPQFRDGITVRIAYRDELPSATDINALDTSRSSDLAIYDDRVVTEVFGQPGKYFGRKTTQPAEVAKYLHLYSLIEHSSHEVVVQDGKMVVADKVLSMVY